MLLRAFKTYSEANKAIALLKDYGIYTVYQYPSKVLISDKTPALIRAYACQVLDANGMVSQ